MSPSPLNTNHDGAGRASGDSPERSLWAAVLLQWLADCVDVRASHSREAGAARYEVRRARMWLERDGFDCICDAAGVDASATRAHFRRAIAQADARVRPQNVGGAPLADADPPVDPNDGTRRVGVGDGTRQHPLPDSSKNRAKKIGEKILEDGAARYERTVDNLTRKMGRPLQMPAVDRRKGPRSPEVRARMARGTREGLARARDAAVGGSAAGANGERSAQQSAAPHQSYKPDLVYRGTVELPLRETLRGGPGLPSRGAADGAIPSHPVGTSEGAIEAAVSTGGDGPTPAVAAGELFKSVNAANEAGEMLSPLHREFGAMDGAIEGMPHVPPGTPLTMSDRMIEMEHMLDDELHTGRADAIENEIADKANEDTLPKGRR